jgi:hypothetical protein
MLSGALIRIPDDLEIEKLDKCRWDRNVRGTDLKSVVQLEGPVLRSGDIVARAAS